MGAWGTAIFSDDLAADVRGDWRDLIGDGLNPAEATDQLIGEYREALSDREERCVFWLALALTQHRAGRLEARVRDQALGVIEDGSDLARWAADPVQRRKRAAVLAKAGQELASPQPSPKRIPKPFRNVCEWAVGEVVSYRLATGDWVPLQVIKLNTDKGGTSPVVALLDWRGPDLPTDAELRHVSACYPLRRANSSYVPPSHFMLGAVSARQMPGVRVQRLGIVQPPRPAQPSFTVILWPNLDGYLERCFGVR
jgi:hypothetical protein